MTTKIVKSSESTTRIPRVSHLTSSTGELADSIVRCWLMTSDLEQPIEPGSKQIGDLCELIDGGLRSAITRLQRRHAAEVKSLRESLEGCRSTVDAHNLVEGGDEQ